MVVPCCCWDLDLLLDSDTDFPRVLGASSFGEEVEEDEGDSPSPSPSAASGGGLVLFRFRVFLLLLPTVVVVSPSGLSVGLDTSTLLLIKAVVSATVPLVMPLLTSVGGTVV